MNITGKDLIDLGYQPGKWFKVAISHANKHQLNKRDLLQYLNGVAPKIQELQPSVPYYKNIRAANVEEEKNIQVVFDTMDILMKTPTVVNGAVMPDACPTGAKGQIPVGGVVATKNAIHPAMHSADICCSLMMTSFGNVDPKKVLDAAHSITHFGGGGREDTFDLPIELEEKIKDNYFLNNEKSLQVAKSHLGTQGDGNHFLFVGRSRTSGETVMVTHHGSRGFGAQLFKQGMKVAEGYRKIISPSTLKTNAWIPYSEEKGKTYWEALQVVREWTKLNHTLLHDTTCRKVKIEAQDRFWNEHNFVFKEDDLFFHAKGATPLDDKFVPDSTNGLRLIPLNMREPVLVVKGATTQNNLGFAPHGAGRNVSRSQHIRNNNNRTTEEVFSEETKGLDIRFYSGHIDISELPTAYKNAESVQLQMDEFQLGEIEDYIDPYGCIMAGDWKIDAPWRKKLKKKNRR